MSATLAVGLYNGVTVIFVFIRNFNNLIKVFEKSLSLNDKESYT